MLLSAGIFHLIQTKKISKQEFKQEAQNFRLITRTNEGREGKLPSPHSSSPKQPRLLLPCSAHSTKASCIPVRRGELIHREKACPNIATPHLQHSWSAVTFPLYGAGKGSQLSKSGCRLVKSKGFVPPKHVNLLDFIPLNPSGITGGGKKKKELSEGLEQNKPLR